MPKGAPIKSIIFMPCHKRLERNFGDYKYGIDYDYSILENNFIVRIKIFYMIFLFPEIPFKTHMAGNKIIDYERGRRPSEFSLNMIIFSS